MSENKPKPPSPDVQPPEDNDALKRAKEYWTDERRRAARPLPLEIDPDAEGEG